MEEEKKLYPFRFCTLEDTYVWGSEEFRLADLGYRDSLIHDGWLAANTMGEVMDMYMDRVVGENVFTFWGRQFPVCVRILKVKGRMPLRVHPDDTLASDRYDFLGKEKLWYVVRAGKDAKLMIGFRKDADATLLYEKCLDNSVEDILNVIAPQAGQSFLIPSGTPHAAAGDIVIAEISESSPLDFCLCTWGQEISEEEFDESLNLVDALDFINYNRYSAPTVAQSSKIGRTLADIDQFNVVELNLKDTLFSRSGQFDSFILYQCVKGEASVQLEVLGQKVDYRFKAGETVLVPAECPDFYLVPLAAGTAVLEVTIPFRTDHDAYINPSAAPTLPED